MMPIFMDKKTDKKARQVTHLWSKSWKLAEALIRLGWNSLFISLYT